MSFIKHPLRPSDITQDNPLYYTYETTQSMAISFDVTNDAGAILVNSSDPNYYNNFTVTIDQLEGEINVPYQYVDRLVDNDDGSQVVERRLDVPNSLLGGFAQWRVNYTFIEFPDAPTYGEGDNQGTFVSGDFNTPRVVVPRYIAPPVVIEPDGFFLNEDDIKEALADKIYDTFFKSDVLETIPLGDVKKLQTTIYQGTLATGRPSDDSPLVFYKKDRNTPENKRDFSSESIQAIVTDISASLSSVDALGDINITGFLDNELTVLDPKKSDEILPSEQIQDGTEDTPEYFYQLTTIELQYKDLEPIPFASFRTLFNTNEAVEENRYVDEFGNIVPIQWQNVLNLSQLTSPITGRRIDRTKAKEVLDSQVFELLPARVTRQDQIDQFFQDFNNLIGVTPSFDDVDDDGAGEQLTSDPASRISQNPNDPSAMITRTDEDANAVNEGKTLESMRNTLNTYLGDVDNVVEEPFDERPEYVNKSTGFLKLRKLNQAIIIRTNTDINSLEKTVEGNTTKRGLAENTVGPDYTRPYYNLDPNVTGPSWMINGFTITMWVRFTNASTNGSLFTYGNPHLQQDGAFRLETLTREKDEVVYQKDGVDTQYYSKPVRIVRLVVWDTLYPYPRQRLYDSHTGGQLFTDNITLPANGQFNNNSIITKIDTNGRSGRNHDALGFASTSAVQEVTLNYNQKRDDNPSKGTAPPLPALEMFNRNPYADVDDRYFLSYTQIPTDNLNEWFFICATYNPLIREDISLHREFLPGSYNPSLYNGGSVYSEFKGNQNFWLNHIGINQGNLMANSGYGNKCKVEVISRSDLLRARGFKVD